MLALVRRHEIFHSLSFWLVSASAGLTTSLVLGVWAVGVQRGGEIGSAKGPLLVVMWIALALFLVFGKLRSRCGRLDITLPVPARQLWLAHVIASILASLALAAFVLAVVGLHLLLLARVPRFQGLELPLFPVAAILCAGVVLAVVVIESLDLERYRVEMSGPDSLRRCTVIAVVLAFSLVISDQSLAFLLLPVGIALAVLLWSYRRLPAALSLVGREPETSSRTRRLSERDVGWAAAGIGVTEGGLLRHLFFIIHGARFGPVTPWISYPMVVLMGAVASGILSIWVPLDDIRYLYIPLYAYILFSPIPAGMEQLAHLDPLPVSRRTLFAILVLPSLAFFGLGYGIGWLGVRLATPDRDLVEYRANRWDPHFYLYVPVGLDEIGWTGRVPTTIAPWGESHPAWEAPLFSGSPVTIYSPFHTPKGSSMEFVAWQISRATEAVYGRRIPADEIRERYLEARGDEVVLETKTLSLVTDYPGLRPLSSGPILPFMLVTTCAWWFWAVAVNARGYRAGVSSGRRKLRWILFLVMTLAVILGLFVLEVSDIVESMAIRGLIEIIIRGIGESVVATAGFWLVSLVSLLVCYRLAERVVVGAELPATPSLPKLM